MVPQLLLVVGTQPVEVAPRRGMELVGLEPATSWVRSRLANRFPATSFRILER